MELRVRVQAEDFDAGAELARLNHEAAGGIASFTGIVRAKGDGARRVVAMTLEHYPGMTERALAEIGAEAGRRWQLTGCVIIHRVGRLLPGETIVFTATASAHRQAALAAAGFLVDWLKTKAPFWKAEEYEDGEVAWVAARATDTAAADRWLDLTTDD